MNSGSVSLQFTLYFKRKKSIEESESFPLWAFVLLIRDIRGCAVSSPCPKQRSAQLLLLNLCYITVSLLITLHQRKP